MEELPAQTKILNFKVSHSDATEAYIRGEVLCSSPIETITIGFPGESSHEVEIHSTQEGLYEFHSKCIRPLHEYNILLCHIRYTSGKEGLQRISLPQLEVASLSKDEIFALSHSLKRPSILPPLRESQFSLIEKAVAEGQRLHHAIEKVLGESVSHEIIWQQLRERKHKENAKEISRVNISPYTARNLQHSHRLAPSTKICIVAVDLMGPIYNGGVGTANTGLAEIYAEAGYSVTLLSTLGTFCEQKDFEYWREEYKRKNITLVPLPASGIELLHHARAVSFHTYQWLKEQNFDWVFFSEMSGAGYDSLCAKKAGLEFNETTLCVIGHSPHKWSQHYNHSFLKNDHLVAIDQLERESLRLADILITPSEYLANWYQDQNWQLPKASFVIPYALPKSITHYEPIETPSNFQEVIFLGRLESRKGLEVFCDAIDILTEDNIHIQKISFLGKPTSIGTESSPDYIKRRSAVWNSEINIQTEFSQPDVVAYIRGNSNSLVVLPSISDNSPFTVYECLWLEIPFVASNAGGIPELIKDKDHLFDPEPKSAARVIKKHLLEAPRVTRPVYTQKAVKKLWYDLIYHPQPALNSKVENTSWHWIIYAEKDDMDLCIKNYHTCKSQVPDLEIQFVSKSKNLLATLEHEGVPKNQLTYSDQVASQALNFAAGNSDKEMLLFSGSKVRVKDIRLLTNPSIRTDIISTFSEVSGYKNNISKVIDTPIGGIGSLLTFRPYNPLFQVCIKRSAFISMGGFKPCLTQAAIFPELYCRATHYQYAHELIPESPLEHIVSSDEFKDYTKWELQSRVSASVHSHEPWLSELIQLSEGIMQDLTYNVPGPEVVWNPRDLDPISFATSDNILLSCNSTHGYKGFTPIGNTEIISNTAELIVKNSELIQLRFPLFSMPSNNHIGIKIKLHSSSDGAIQLIGTKAFNPLAPGQIIGVKKLLHGDNTITMVSGCRDLSGLITLELPAGIARIQQIEMRGLHFSNRFYNDLEARSHRGYRPTP